MDQCVWWWWWGLEELSTEHHCCCCCRMLYMLWVRVTEGLPLLLSLTECSRVTSLQLQHLSWAERDELLVQVSAARSPSARSPSALSVLSDALPARSCHIQPAGICSWGGSRAAAAAAGRVMVGLAELTSRLEGATSSL